MELISISGVLYRRNVSSDSVISTNVVSRSHATHKLELYRRGRFACTARPPGKKHKSAG